MATASSPASRRRRAQSVAEMRTDIGFVSGHAARIAAKTSSGNRSRFSSDPPYSSVRWLLTGVRKLESR